MEFSIIIPTLNNLEYLKFCIESIKKNSNFNHEILPHVNIGNDGTLKYLQKENIDYTFTDYNAGICKGMNLAADKSTKEYLLYAHDDFYFCPDWDLILKNEINLIGHNDFYLSGIMMNNGQIKFDCGDSVQNFDEKKFLENYKKNNLFDFQGSTWAPHLIHKKIWNKVGGFSEEFFPGTGSDPDLNLKLWNIGVRTFKGLKNCMVYHFGSIVTRKYKDKKTTTESGSKGDKIFLKKWGFKIKFFTKYYLRGCYSKNGKIHCREFDGPLKDPNKNFNYYRDLSLNKLAYIFYSYLKR